MNLSCNRSFFLRELQALAAQVTGEEVCLVEGEAGCSWSWNWNDRRITVSPDYLTEKAADVCRGILMHESAHCAITRLQHLMENSRRCLYQDILNVLEDFRIESWLASAFPGCAAWLDSANRLILLEIADKPWQAGYQIQFLRGLMEWGFSHTFPAKGPADCVKEALLETHEAVAKQTACHPGSARGRGAAIETMKAQQRMIEIFENEIRPVWERLVALDEIEGRSRITTIVGENLIPISMPRNKTIRRKSGVRKRSFLNSPGDVPERNYMERAFALSSLIDPLADELIHLLETTARLKPITGQRQGDRVDMRTAMQAEANPRLRDQVWMRRRNPIRFDPLIVLALDCSASMDGENFDSAFEAIVMLSEVCLRSGLPMSLWTFNNQVRQIVIPHGQEDTAFHRLQIDKIRKCCGGSTAMHLALSSIHSSPELQQFANPIVFIVSDGDPDNKDYTISSLKKFEAGNVPVFGIGIGDETREMLSLFPNSLVVPNVPALAQRLAKVLTKTIRSQIDCAGPVPGCRAA